MAKGCKRVAGIAESGNRQQDSRKRLQQECGQRPGSWGHTPFSRSVRIIFTSPADAASWIGTKPPSVWAWQLAPHCSSSQALSASPCITQVRSWELRGFL